MERFFILDKYNTWYDWGLIVTSKDITPPEPKTNLVELDGMSGSLDLSESLTGEIAYKDRTISASFWTDKGTRKDREKLLQQIIATLHGKKIKIIEPDDPAHYFLGRIKVKSYDNILPYAELSIEATCEPWRYAIEETERMVTLDNQTVKVVINNDGVKSLCPTLTTSAFASMTMMYKNKLTGFYEIPTLTAHSTYKISDFKLYQGVNTVQLSGEGSITFTYREATL